MSSGAVHPSTIEDRVSVEVAELRRCVRDLVALSALPAIWVGYRPLKMAESLAEALLTMLQLDFVFVQLAASEDGAVQRVLRLQGAGDRKIRLDELAVSLSPLLSRDSDATTLDIVLPGSNVATRAAAAPFGHAKHGVLVAGSVRPGFPTEAERLLLNVGANQAAILLERQQIEGETRRAKAAAELHATQLKSVARAMVAIASAASISDALHAVTEAARHIIGAHQSVICMGQPVDGAYAIRSLSLSEKYAVYRNQGALRDGAGVYAGVCRTGRPARLTDHELARREQSSQAVHDGSGMPGRGLLVVPLVTRDGHNLGLLQVSDKYDGQFTPEDESILTQFAQVAAAAIEAKDLNQVLAGHVEQLKLALDASQLGEWQWDAASDVVTFSDRASEIFGLPPGPYMTWTHMRDLLHEEDRERARLAVETALAEHGQYDITYRVIREDGRQVWVSAMGCGRYNENGQVIGMIGFVQDVTQRQEAAVERERLLASEREARSEAEALISVGKALSSELELHRPVQMATDAATALCGAEFGAFFYNIINAVGESYTLYTLSGVPRESFERFPMPRNTEVFGPTFRGEGIIRLDDVTKDPRYGRNPPYHGMPAGHLPVRSYLAVPVVSRAGEVLGGLFFGHSEVGRFTERHERLAAGIASQAAVAIDNARLYESAQASKRATEHSLSQLQAVVGSMTEGLVIADPQGEMLTMNPAALAIHGFSTVEEMLGKLSDYPDMFKLHDADGTFLPLESWPISRVLRGERFSGFEVQVHRRDTGQTWIGSYGGTPVWDGDGKLVLAVLTLRDVTEQKRTQAALAESEAKFRQLADTIPQLAWMARADGWIFWYNRRWYEYTGTTPEQMEGWGWQRVHDPMELPRVMERWKQSLQTGETFEMEFPIRSAAGEFRWFLTRVAPFRDAQGQIILWFGTNTDIEDQRRVTEERAQLLESERSARTQIERASQLKDEFLATLGHELRTPLNAILGWSQILKMGPQSDSDLAEGLDVIERNARAQTQIIEDLLDMSRIISGKIRLQVQRLDLADVVQAAIDTVRPAAQAKQIRLQAVLDHHSGPVPGDPNRLQQVFWNLLNNAIKFTPRGGRVQVLLERINSHVEVSVIDSGEGIDPQFVPHLFERFRQADASTTRRHGGLGLGLAIARSLVELHGGTVRAHSLGAGRGSTFVVALPLTVMHSAPEDEVERQHPRLAATAPLTCEADLTGIEVLIVDDEPDARTMIARLLKDRGASVSAASSAPEALRVVQDRWPHVLISDIGMPGEDGYSLIKRVRSLGDRGRELPAIALTAYARAEDRMRSIMAGFQMHMAKPVEPAELIAMVASLTARARPQ